MKIMYLVTTPPVVWLSRLASPINDQPDHMHVYTWSYNTDITLIATQGVHIVQRVVTCATLNDFKNSLFSSRASEDEVFTITSFTTSLSVDTSLSSTLDSTPTIHSNNTLCMGGGGGGGVVVQCKQKVNIYTAGYDMLY